MESVVIVTSTNEAYELVKHADRAKEEECQYASVSQRCPPVVLPPLMSEERKGEALMAFSSTFPSSYPWMPSSSFVTH